MIYIKLRIPLLILSILLISGCNSATVREQSGVALPKWIDNPEYPGYVGITASAQPQQMGGIEAQRRVAHMLARAEMARVRSTSVQSDTRIETTASKSGVTINADDFRRASTAQALQLNDVKVIEEWTHPETGELFIWLAYPVTP